MVRQSLITGMFVATLMLNITAEAQKPNSPLAVCRHILDAGIAEELVEITNDDKFGTTLASACSMNYQQLSSDVSNSAFRHSHLCSSSSEQSSRTVSGNFDADIFDIFSGGGGGSSSRAESRAQQYCSTFTNSATSSAKNFAEWKSKNCSDFSDINSSAIYTFRAHKTLNEVAINAWRDCVTQEVRTGDETIACWAEPQDSPNEAAIIIEYFDRRGQRGTVKSSSLSRGSIVINATVPPRQLFESGEQLDFGRNLRVVERENESQSISANLEVRSGNQFSQVCDPLFIPAVEQPKPIEVEGVWKFSFGGWAGEMSVESFDDEWVFARGVFALQGARNLYGDGGKPGGVGFAGIGKRNGRNLDVAWHIGAPRKGDVLPYIEILYDLITDQGVNFDLPEKEVDRMRISIDELQLNGIGTSTKDYGDGPLNIQFHKCPACQARYKIIQ